MELPFDDSNFKNLEKPIFLHTKEKNVSANPLNGVKLGNTIKKAVVNGIYKLISK